MKLLLFLLLSAMIAFVACNSEFGDYSYVSTFLIAQSFSYELIKQRLENKSLNEIDVSYVGTDCFAEKKLVMSGTINKKIIKNYQ